MSPFSLDERRWESHRLGVVGLVAAGILTTVLAGIQATTEPCRPANVACGPPLVAARVGGQVLAGALAIGTLPRYARVSPFRRLRPLFALVGGVLALFFATYIAGNRVAEHSFNSVAMASVVAYVLLGAGLLLTAVVVRR